MQISSTQLYTLLGMRGEHIMEIILMKTHHEYLNYWTAYKDFATEDLPVLTNFHNFIDHKDTTGRENDRFQEED